jgi:hypothetical protein
MRKVILIVEYIGLTLQAKNNVFLKNYTYLSIVRTIWDRYVVTFSTSGIECKLNYCLNTEIILIRIQI